MRIVTTLMIRDEADIVGAMLTHQREQGVDHVIVTDNASVDGTVDLLRTFERQGFVTLWHDPEHRKQQYRVVTRMEAMTHLVHRQDGELEFVIALTRAR